MGDSSRHSHHVQGLEGGPVGHKCGRVDGPLSVVEGGEFPCHTRDHGSLPGPSKIQRSVYGESLTDTSPSTRCADL